MIGLRVGGRGGGPSAMGILNPMTGKQKVDPDNSMSPFVGWVDSTRYIAANRGDLHFMSADSGKVVETVANTSGVMFLAPAPTSAPGPFIASVGQRNGDAIMFRHSDLGAGHLVWTEPSPAGPQGQETPRVDPLGEYVAWTLHRTGRAFVAFKSVGDSSLTPPTLLGQQYQHAYFCDWTEQGTLLINTSQDMQHWRLAIITRSGSLVRELSTPTPPGEGVVASWRKYEHR
jgi:hypothetical protein